MNGEHDFISFYLGRSLCARLKKKYVKAHSLAEVWEITYSDED
jgi:hypothetical protein